MDTADIIHEMDISASQTEIAIRNENYEQRTLMDTTNWAHHRTDFGNVRVSPQGDMLIDRSTTEAFFSLLMKLKSSLYH